MAEVLLEYEDPIYDPAGEAYVARACGAEADDAQRRWHCWIELLPAGGGRAVRTPQETTQRDRADAEMWAAGLTPVYLDGALERALHHDVAEAPTPVPEAPNRASSAGDRGVPEPTGFARVGGMHELKERVRRIVEIAHLRREQARQYGVVRNGILLHGPPGCGKSFFVEAMAEELGLRLLRVPLESVVSQYVGGAPAALHEPFEQARAQRPCVLFFDELDAIACNRHGVATAHERQMVDAFLQEIDVHRSDPGLLIVAATNMVEELDPAVVREGRFDYKVAVGKPDFEARLEILQTLLRDRPHDPGLDTTWLAHDTEGLSAAQLRGLVDEAALAALEASEPIGEDHLRAAYRAHATEGRYTGATLRWRDVVLPAESKSKLQALQKLLENPRLARELGVGTPSGALLYGPPGTGKTTIARVLASETQASFFSVNASDILSRWLGESEQRVKDLFNRAREQVPAIVFVDEVDAVAQRRAEQASSADRTLNSVVNTLLAEMDGLDSSSRVLVIGATNRPELLDEAFVRPGRLEEAIEVALPDDTQRRTLLELFTENMRLAPSVDLDALAAQTRGASGADLEGVCKLAGRNAFVRELGGDEDGPPAVTMQDFEQALRDQGPRHAWAPQRAPIGFRA